MKYDSSECRYRTHELTSPYLGGQNPLHVLLPDHLGADERCRVLYVLPVEAGEGRKYGDAMATIRDLDLHNRLRLICVMPTFDTLPWYADHASDPAIRHDRHIVDVVVPFIDSFYPTLGAASGRLLLGFSKSGWGAVCLISRHPDLFDSAGTWDAPLLMGPEMFGIWGTGAHYGTRENFAANLPSRLLAENAAAFRGRCRIVHAGKWGFGTGSDPAFPYTGPSHLEGFHELMDGLAIKHVYLPDLHVPHTWNAAWVEPVVMSLTEL